MRKYSISSSVSIRQISGRSKLEPSARVTLAITFCRALNIPARYTAGYLGDIGVPPAPYPMDFSAWFEAYLGGRWWHAHVRPGTFPAEGCAAAAGETGSATAARRPRSG